MDNEKTIAKRDQWMDWAGFTLAAPCATITLNLFLLPENKRDLNKISKAKEQVFLLLNILNTQLINNNYILGDEFSLADIPAGCWYNRCQKFNFDFSNFDGINAWVSKLRKRDAYKNNVISAPLPPN